MGKPSGVKNRSVPSGRLATGWDADVKAVRKRSKYSGRTYARYRKGYWHRYRRQRKGRFLRILGNLKARLADKPDPYPVRVPGTRGRPPMPPKAVLIAFLFKVLLDLSYNDTEAFLRWATWDGLVVRVPAAGTIQEHVADLPEAYLEAMLLECASALNGEVVILLDATGLSTQAYGRWRTARFASRKVRRRYVKVHLSVDLRTGTVFLGLASKGWKGDAPFGLRLVERLGSALRRFGLTVERAMGDAAYGTRALATEVEGLGGTPWFKVRRDATGKAGGHPAWRRMVLRQREEPEGFRAVYAYRVVIEGIISALKRLFGTTIASKKRHNQDVEVLCRLLLWNYGRLDLR